MKVIRANTAGFCMGVSLALYKLDREIEQLATDSQDSSPNDVEHDSYIATYGPIIHNPQVLKKYEDMGVRCIHDIHNASANGRIVIRAHGIPQEEEQRLHACGAYVIDATCPKVKRAQLGIDEQRRTGRTLLLFGEASHPEVLGLLSYAGAGAIVFSDEESFEKIELSQESLYFLAAQTTQDRAAFERIKVRLQERLGHTVPTLETICDATRLRQEEAIAIAQQVDAMVVIGGFNSGNTRRLAAVAEDQGVFTVHVETTEQLPLEKLRTCKTIGLTAGASTPKDLIDTAEQLLASLS